MKYDKNGTPVYMTDEQCVAKFPYTYKQCLDEVRKQCPNVKRNKRFNARIAQLRRQFGSLWHERKLNPNNSKTSKTKMYSEKFLKQVITRCEPFSWFDRNSHACLLNSKT